MSEREELLARVQKATGPDREIDVAIMAACFEWAKAEPPYYAPHCVGDEPIYWHAPSWLRKRPCPELTGSIDAALALVERVLPGNDVLVMRDTGQWEANIGPQESFVSFEGKCSNAPLSILAALLAALQPPEAP